MRAVDLAKVDLNLLIVLDALLETRSVTKAAERLGTSQPAVSRSLAKLRDLFDDTLLVKGARGMTPTMRAEALAEPLARLLAGVEEFLIQPSFDPASTDRVFRLATTDYGALAVLPAVMRRFSEEAPRAGIEVVPFSREVFRALAEGQVDLLLYADGRVPGSFRTMKLFEESFVSLVRTGHPLLGDSGRDRVIPLADFAAWPQVMVSIFGGTSGPVDTALAAFGLKRHIALCVPYFATAAVIASSSDLVVTMPSRIARQLGSHLGLVELNMPSFVSGYGYRLLWHERSHGDLGAAWLRRLIRRGVRQEADDPTVILPDHQPPDRPADASGD